MRFIVNLLIGGLAVFISAYIIPGVTVDSFVTAVLVGIVLGIINALVKPIFVFFTLPLTVVTLGLFLFVINSLMILLASAIVPGFKVNGFWTALVFSLVLSVVSWFLHSIA